MEAKGAGGVFLLLGPKSILVWEGGVEMKERKGVVVGAGRSLKKVGKDEMGRRGERESESSD